MTIEVRENYTVSGGVGPTSDLPRAAEQAYNSLRRDILSGKLPANTILQEKELGELIGVSRTPVREALSRLRAEGLVVMERYHKHFVAEFTESDRVEVYEIRAMLEGNAAAKACSRLSDADIVRLMAICTEIEAEIEAKGDEARPRFELLNREFHATIWQAADRPRSHRLLDSALSLPFNALGRYSGNLSTSMRRACWYHREIVSAFRARDESRARTQMAAHVLSLITTEF